MRRTCDQCGKEVTKGAVFCPNCGAPLKRTIKKTKGKYWMMVLPIVLVMILILAGIGLRSYLTSDGYRCKKILQMAEKHCEAEEYEAALDCYQEALETDNSNVDIYLKCADVYLMQQSYEQAFRILTEGLESIETEENKSLLKEKLADVCLKKADSFLDKGDYEQAIEVLQEVQKMIGETSGGVLTDKEKNIRENVVLINEKIFDMDGVLEAEVIYEYDENGKLKKVTEKMEENASWVGDAYNNTVHGVVYEFDDNIIKIDYEPDTPNRQVKTAYEFTYWEDGNDADEEVFDIDGSKELFKKFAGLNRYVPTTNLNKLSCTRLLDDTAEVVFDKNGNITKYSYHSALEDINYDYTYKYNENGAVTEVVCHDENGNLVLHNTCEYDKKENLINVTEWDENDNEETWYDFEYDQEGRMKRKIQYAVIDDRLYTGSFEYEYDEDGHQVQYVIKSDYGEAKIWEKSYDTLGNMLSHKVLGYAQEFRFCTVSYEYGYIGG